MKPLTADDYRQAVACFNATNENLLDRQPDIMAAYLNYRDYGVVCSFELHLELKEAKEEYWQVCADLGLDVNLNRESVTASEPFTGHWAFDAFEPQSWYLLAQETRLIRESE